MDIRFFLVGEGHAVIGEFRADYPVLDYRVDYLLTRLLYRVGVGAVGVVFVAAALKEVLVLAQEVPEGDTMPSAPLDGEAATASAAVPDSAMDGTGSGSEVSAD